MNPFSCRGVRSALGVLGLAASIGLPAGGQAQSLLLAAGDSSRLQVAPGASIRVPLIADFSGSVGVNLASLSTGLTWDATRLTLDSIRAVSSTGLSLTTNTTSAGSGTASLSLFGASGVRTTGPIANAFFTATALAGGSRVLLSPTTAGNEVGENIRALLRPRGLGVCVAPTGRWGDVNDDGAANIIDAQQIARFTVGLSVANTSALTARADVTADGNTDIIDAQQIARFTVGLNAVARVNSTMYTAPAVTTMSVTLSDTSSLSVGGTIMLSPNPRDGTGASVAGCAPVTYASSAPAIATVATNGLVTAIAPGTATISATAGGTTGGAQVTVLGPGPSSCRQLLTLIPSANSGTYTIFPDGTQGSQTTAYCDMNTDGGGWTKVLGHTITNGVTREVPLGAVTAGLAIAAIDSGMVSTPALSQLRTLIGFSEIRLLCYKTQTGKRVHIKTASVAVLDWLTGRTDTQPNAVGSFTAYADDNSFLSVNPSRWGFSNGSYNVGKWGDGNALVAPRLLAQPMFVGMTAHWLVRDGRMECDDHIVGAGWTGPNGQWSAFVR